MAFFFFLLRGSVSFVPSLRLLGDAEQLIRRALEDLAQRLNVFIADRARLIIHHTAEILVAHAKLVVEPVLRLPLFLQKR